MCLSVLISACLFLKTLWENTSTLMIERLSHISALWFSRHSSNEQNSGYPDHKQGCAIFCSMLLWRLDTKLEALTAR